MTVVLGFLLFRVMPGDPVTLLNRGRPVSGAELDRIRHDLGLDKSLPAQFVDYVGKLLHGDFGQSYNYNAPAGQVIADRIWPTVLLVGLATLIAAALGLWLGAKSAWRRGSLFD